MASSKSLAKKRHSDQWWAEHAPPGVLRCAASQKNGRLCNLEAVPGLNVCGQHGGKTPAAIAAAFTRLGDSVEDAADVVKEIMNDPEQASRDRLVAAFQVMKLLGMEKERVEVTVKTDPIEDLFRGLLAADDGLSPATPTPVLRSAESLARDRAADPQEADYEDDVVEAELVEEPDDPHTVHVTESMSSRPPKHIREALERLI